MGTEEAGHVMHVIAPRGEFDVYTAAALERDVDQAVSEAERDGADVVIDLRDVTFIDLTAIGVLEGARIRLAASGAHLRLVRPAPGVRRVVELVGLTDLLV